MISSVVVCPVNLPVIRDIIWVNRINNVLLAKLREVGSGHNVPIPMQPRPHHLRATNLVKPLNVRRVGLHQNLVIGDSRRNKHPMKSGVLLKELITHRVFGYPITRFYPSMAHASRVRSTPNPLMRHIVRASQTSNHLGEPLIGGKVTQFVPPNPSRLETLIICGISWVPHKPQVKFSPIRPFPNLLIRIIRSTGLGVKLETLSNHLL